MDSKQRPHVVELEFAIGDQVSFGQKDGSGDTPYEGYVRAITILEDGKSYQIGYWKDGTYSLIWLIAPELTMLKVRTLA